jgi:BolA protein
MTPPAAAPSAPPSPRPGAARLEAWLRAAFPEATMLEVRDDSAHHAGHAGAREGGHYHLRIASPRFAGLPPVARHRLIYSALGPLAALGVHALSIEALPA